MAQFREGEPVRVPEDAWGVFSKYDARAGQRGTVVKVHDQVFLKAYRVEFEDGTREEMLASKLVSAKEDFPFEEVST